MHSLDVHETHATTYAYSYKAKHRSKFGLLRGLICGLRLWSNRNNEALLVIEQDFLSAKFADPKFMKNSRKTYSFIGFGKRLLERVWRVTDRSNSTLCIKKVKDVGHQKKQPWKHSAYLITFLKSIKEYHAHD